MSTATTNFIQQRQYLVDQLRRQGIRDRRVLKTLGTVRREAFLPPELEEFAYRDTALPIGNEQTISQPFIVALMAAALELSPEDRVLEVGTGSGYAAAVLSKLAAEVYTIERFETLADQARARLIAEGFENVHFRCGDGTQGWPEQAPFDAITVAAGGRGAPQPLLDQLAVGGRLVIPLGPTKASQTLTRITKTAEGEFDEEELGGVRFVPLVGVSGWDGEEDAWDGTPEAEAQQAEITVANELSRAAEPFESIETADLQPLLDRIGESRLVLIGESSHGTSEFYRMRARITQALIEKHGFDFVAVEADWPDAARVDRYVRQNESDKVPWQAFSRFPAWMWRNEETGAFIEWLHDHNQQQADGDDKVGFHGLDLYSMFTSVQKVLDYLDDVDPEAARVARQRYGCLSPWEGDPQSYGWAAISGRYRDCESDAVSMLRDLMERRLEYTARDGRQFFDARRNAELVANAARYYRVMYYGDVQSWNLRDQHMFETVESLMQFYDRPDHQAKGVLWAHNSHLGDASATEMGKRGETNLGQLCREHYHDQAYLIGQGTDRGTVAAARGWDEPMETMTVRPAHESSFERLCHEAGQPRFFLPLRAPSDPELRAFLQPSRLQRAIGVVYRPQTELQSHYFHSRVPYQFDEWIWFDESSAVHPVTEQQARRHPPQHPFSLID